MRTAFQNLKSVLYGPSELVCVKKFQKFPIFSAVLWKVQGSTFLKWTVVKESVVTADGTDQWFLPHFPVVCEDHTTTKVRIVFDGSAKVNGLAINDHMHTGPKLQSDLVNGLLRFCRHPVTIAADVLFNLPRPICQLADWSADLQIALHDLPIIQESV